MKKREGSETDDEPRFPCLAVRASKGAGDGGRAKQGSGADGMVGQVAQ
jgi:hypothetical protein